MSNTTTTTSPTNSTNWGYQPDGYDPEDPPYTYNGNWVGHSDSEGVNLLDLYPGAFQADLPPTGSCVVDAVAGLITYLQYMQSNSLPNSATPTKSTPPPITQQPSRRFMYYNGRAVALMKQQNNPQAWPTGFTDTGVSIRDAINGINTFGLVSDGQFPWLTQNFPAMGNINVGVNDLPSEGLYGSAANTPLFAPARLDVPANPKVESIETKAEYKAEAMTTLFHVQQCLWEGYPVIFAFHYYWQNFETVASPEEGEYPTIKTITREENKEGLDPKFPTHVGMVIAYESKREATRVLVKSMWGDNDIPYFWMPYDWILNFMATESFWTLRVSSAKPQRDIIQTSTYTFTKCQSGARVPSMETLVAPNGSISCVSRGPEILDLFWRVDSGGVNRSYKYPETPWAWACVPPDGLGLPGGGGQGAIAAISPDPSVMYLFWIGGDGSVWYVKTDDTGLKIEAPSHAATEWDFQSKVMISPPGTAGTGGGLAVTNRASGDAYDPQGPGTVQLYWIGSDGSVEVANNFINASEWVVQQQIAGPGSAAPSSNIAAAADLPQYGIGDGYEESVWWISPDNQLKAMLNGSTGTDSIWQDVSPDCAAIKGSRLAAAHCVDSRNAFYLSPTGIVHMAKSYMGGSTADDQPLSSTALVRAGSDISVVSTGTDVVVCWADNYSGLSSGVMSSASVTTLSGPWLIGEGGSIRVTTVVDGTQVVYMSPLWWCCYDSWPAPSSPSS
ncbi:cysteine ase [Fusarium agapanthi]|uniref:Cysteine ase n=1 Tax=Fusarium agapanthi TaxID=1803897 RepID=A0A9P5BGY8_9HYPO|nr:cysteine ase [Fusarium agapanthi]